jgi:lipoprotein-anchoring transpeptidase ErfK/SrfK
VGAPGTTTPAGRFYVLERLTTLRDPAYGSYAIGTSAYAPTLSEWPGGGVVGIHGTNEPQLIPGRPSHGCIRMRGEDISRLWRLISLGTPIEIV